MRDGSGIAEIGETNRENSERWSITSVIIVMVIDAMTETVWKRGGGEKEGHAPSGGLKVGFSTPRERKQLRVVRTMLLAVPLVSYLFSLWPLIFSTEPTTPNEVNNLNPP